MRENILAAARVVLIRGDLTGWTMAEVAREAGCAKGLVHYHFKTKATLLRDVAATMKESRTEARIGALSGEGTAALDSLWAVLKRETASGEFRTWLGLLALDQKELREILQQHAGPGLGKAAAEALALPVVPPDGFLEAILDGFQIALLGSADPAGLRDAYDRFWLGLLG